MFIGHLVQRNELNVAILVDSTVMTLFPWKNFVLVFIFTRKD
jgi:hypothetical protein